MGAPLIHFSGHGNPEISLVCAMLIQAMKEMRDERKSERIPAEGSTNALIWLGSQDAAVWFDLVGVDHKYALDGMDWFQRAEDLMEQTPPVNLSNDQRQLLEDNIKELYGNENV